MSAGIDSRRSELVSDGLRHSGDASVVSKRIGNLHKTPFGRPVIEPFTAIHPHVTSVSGGRPPEALEPVTGAVDLSASLLHELTRRHWFAA